MTAVAAKARGKAPKATPKKIDLDGLLAEMQQVLRKIEAVHHAAEPGSTTETLLRLVVEDLMPDALAHIHHEHPIRDHLDATYNALFAPLAVISAAIQALEGTTIESALIEVHDTLDTLHTQMDSAGLIARALPSERPASETWWDLAQAGTGRICEMLYECCEGTGRSSNSPIQELVENAQMVTYFLKVSPTSGMPWAEKDGDPTFVMTLLQSAADLLSWAEEKHAVAGGMSDMQVAIIPTAKAMLAELHEALFETPGNLQRLKAFPSSTAAPSHRSARSARASAIEPRRDAGIDWIGIDLAGGELEATRILLEIASEECQWQFADAEQSGAAQERLCVLLSAARDRVEEARTKLQGVVAEERAKQC